MPRRRSLLEVFKDEIRRGTVPEVARHKVRTALLRRRKQPGTVARHVDRINEILDRAEDEVREEMESHDPDPAA